MLLRLWEYLGPFSLVFYNRFNDEIIRETARSEAVFGHFSPVFCYFWHYFPLFVKSVAAWPFDLKSLENGLNWAFGALPDMKIQNFFDESVSRLLTWRGLDWARAKWGGFASWFIKTGEKNAVKYADEIIVLSKNVQELFGVSKRRRVYQCC